MLFVGKYMSEIRSLLSRPRPAGLLRLGWGHCFKGADWAGPGWAVRPTPSVGFTAKSVDHGAAPPRPAPPARPG